MPMIPFARPMWGEQERSAALSAMDQHVLTNGPTVEEFEELFAAYIGTRYAVAVSSCTAALHICAVIWGRNLAVPALTHPATAHAVKLAGYEPIFLDVEKESGSMVSGIDAVGVEFLGVNPIIIDGFWDSALNIQPVPPVPGAETRCFSFHPVKQMTTGEGGMIATNDQSVAIDARKLRHFGQGATRNAECVGMNYRMTEVQAAIGMEQLKKLPEFLRIREENWCALDRSLWVHRMFNIVFDIPGRYTYALKVSDRAVVRAKLSDFVETSVYYDPIVPDMDAYRVEGDFSVSRETSKTILCLPIGPHVTNAAEIGERAAEILYEG